jgi:hypothetical protein
MMVAILETRSGRLPLLEALAVSTVSRLVPAVISKLTIGSRTNLTSYGESKIASRSVHWVH